MTEHRHRADEADARPVKKSSILKETAIIVFGALVLSWLIKTFLVQAFYIPSASMEDTLIKNDRIMVSKMVPEVFDLHRGDVVVFKDPGGWLNGVSQEEDSNGQKFVRDILTFIGVLPQDAGSHLVKRVIGLPGDTVKCCSEEGLMTINGEPIDETSYLKPGVAASDVEFEVIVPKGKIWVQGDNRDHSADSRAHIGAAGGGFVPLDNVVGTAFVKVWPWDRTGWLKNPSEVFEDVPEPETASK